jgi:ribose 5-phosphate isomerase B
MPKVYLAGDHAFFSLKGILVEYVRSLGYVVEDLGPHTLDPEDDYPDSVSLCAKRVAEESGSFGIIGGGSGQGEAMAANRFKGIRAAVFYGREDLTEGGTGDGYDSVRLARFHNDANILSIGARFVTGEEAKKAVSIFLSMLFSGKERHQRRVDKLS